MIPAAFTGTPTGRLGCAAQPGYIEYRGIVFPAAMEFPYYPMYRNFREKDEFPVLQRRRASCGRRERCNTSNEGRMEMSAELDAEMGAETAIIGAGFAGSEAAWQLAERGISTVLYEMRPARNTEAHQTGDCAELVCSNSFKSRNPENAHGLLKAELALQGSLILQVAEETAVPAGQALAVDRVRFARRITERLEAHPRIRLRREEATSLDALLASHRAVIVASGPLTSPALSEELRRYTGDHWLYFHDAIAPVIIADSIDREVVYAASRYGKGGADYLNCPLDEAQYHALIQQVREAETVPFHAFESLRPFEGCLPIEVMAERGALTLAFGPMKPVGLPDPRTGRDPFAVVQLRQEDRRGSLYGMVGFQTKMTWPEQRRVLRTIPGLEHAEFARLGSLHRNTFLNAPALLDADLALKGNVTGEDAHKSGKGGGTGLEPGRRLYFAGQITGVEGYMESTAMGLYAARRAAAHLRGTGAPRPSPATMTGALVRYLLESPPHRFQPMNASFGLLDPPPGRMNRKARKTFYAQRALAEMERLEGMEEEEETNSGNAHASRTGAPVRTPRTVPGQGSHGR